MDEYRSEAAVTLEEGCEGEGDAKGREMRRGGRWEGEGDGKRRKVRRKQSDDALNAFHTK